ncbi:flavodoxin family protein [bacterium]|nr:flavodoxin family protein [bacterium]
MNVTLLNGNPDTSETDFDDYLASLAHQLETAGHNVSSLTLRELEARYCTGCWACWVRTPGLCIHEDASREVCRHVIQSDFVLFASPIIMGYMSATLKKFMDKMIPLVHPYITVANAETHHRARYAKADYPAAGLLLGRTPGTDEEDIDIVRSIHERTMLNLKTHSAFTLLTDAPVEEVANAINHL